MLRNARWAGRPTETARASFDIRLVERGRIGVCGATCPTSEDGPRIELLDSEFSDSEFLPPLTPPSCLLRLRFARGMVTGVGGDA
jgi:hypothetical protein